MNNKLPNSIPAGQLLPASVNRVAQVSLPVNTSGTVSEAVEHLGDRITTLSELLDQLETGLHNLGVLSPSQPPPPGNGIPASTVPARSRLGADVNGQAERVRELTRTVDDLITRLDR